MRSAVQSQLFPSSDLYGTYVRGLTLLETLAAAALLTLMLGVLIPLVSDIARAGATPKTEMTTEAIALELVADWLMENSKESGIEGKALAEIDARQMLAVPVRLETDDLKLADVVEVRVVHTFGQDTGRFVVLELRGGPDTTTRVMRIGDADAEDAKDEQ